MDLLSLIEDPVLSVKSAIDAKLSEVYTVTPVKIAKDSDGHIAEMTPVIKKDVIGVDGTTITPTQMTTLAGAPIHFAGGGGVSCTHPVKEGDEGVALHCKDSPQIQLQKGDVQNPADANQFDYSFTRYLPGGRSDPRKLQQVSQDAHHIRSDDKKHVHETHPKDGFKKKSVDPSTPAASESFDPFKEATKFFESLLHPSDGHAHNATDGGITHTIKNDHIGGPILSALNGAHTINAHPTNGAAIASTIAHTIAAPNASLDKAGNLKTKQSMSAPTGGFGSLSVGGGAGSSGGGGNSVTGVLDGDVTGPEQTNRVVGITHVANADTLPVCASDSDAATAGVAIGGLYVNNTVNSSLHILCVRWA